MQNAEFEVIGFKGQVYNARNVFFVRWLFLSFIFSVQASTLSAAMTLAWLELASV